jgi:biopolymer transport protein ExbD
LKLPRNARIARNRLDAAPFAAVFFLLLLFMMLLSLVYTPGIRVPLDLPTADDLPGTDKMTVAVAIDANGQSYFQNQPFEELELKLRLRKAVANAREPLSLIVQADKAVTYERLMGLRLLARDAGIKEVWLATLPRPIASAKSAARR